MARPEQLPTDALQGVSILVVDDDADARDLLRTVLEYCGAAVTVASSAEEALDAIERVPPDVLLTDISMPRRDGYWLIEQVRSLPPGRGGDTPAVAITAHGYTHGPERTLPAGFRSHLRKPVDPWELCRVLSDFARR